jgi:hypothetical protein
MMIANQDRPLILCLPVPFRPARSAHADFCADLGSPERIDAGIHRIGQDRQNRVVERRLPIDLLLSVPISYRRQRDLFLPKPQQRLAGAPALLEFVEHQSNRVLHPQVWIELDRTV